MKYFNYFTTSVIRMFTIMSASFVWLNYYFRKFAHAFPIALIVSLTIEIILFVKWRKDTRQNNLNKSHNALIGNIKFALIHSTLSTNINYYANILKSKYCSQKYKDCIVAIVDNKKVCFVPTYHSNVSLDNVTDSIAIADMHNADKLVILTTNYPSQITDYISSLGGMEIEVYDIEKTYSTFLMGNTLPTCKVYEKQNKVNVKKLFTVAFDKSKTKAYLASGLILMLSSLLVPFSLYYIISGSVLLIFALVCYTKKEQVSFALF